MISAIGAATNKIKTKVSEGLLSMVTFDYLRSLNAGYKDGWFCDGKKISGCRGKGGNGDPDEYHWHCVQCSFDMCDGCYEIWGNDHEHPLEHLVHSKIRELHNGGYSSWGCDGRKIQSKCTQMSIKNPTDILYHDFKNNFDLCQGCADKWRID